MSFRSDWREGAVFSWLICGGNRSSTAGGECRRGQNSPADKSLKRPAREPRNRRKGISGLPPVFHSNQIEIRESRFRSKVGVTSTYCVLKHDLLPHRFLRGAFFLLRIFA